MNINYPNNPYYVGDGGYCARCGAWVYESLHNCAWVYPWTITTPNTTPPVVEPQTTEPEPMTFTDEYLDALLDALADRTRSRALEAAAEYQKAQTETWKVQSKEQEAKRVSAAADRLEDQYRQYRVS